MVGSAECCGMLYCSFVAHLNHAVGVTSSDGLEVLQFHRLTLFKSCCSCARVAMNCGQSFESERLVCFSYVSFVLAISQTHPLLNCAVCWRLIHLIIHLWSRRVVGHRCWMEVWISDDFCKSERFSMSQLNVKFLWDFSDQGLPVES